jgi:RimJ/RimL family protein N-acetyltransferase
MTKARLLDGSAIELRPVVAADEQAIEDLLSGLSLRSRVFRFFGAGASPHLAAHHAIEVAGRASYGVVAVTDDGQLVGHAMYALRRPDSVEVGLEVADAWQGRGIGTAMLAALAQTAADNGFESIEAVVMPENHRMLGVFEDCGVPVEITNEPGVVHLSARAASWAAAAMTRLST